MKSCTRTFSGSPLGRSSRPPFLKSPTNSFFLVSTRDDRLFAAQGPLHLAVEMLELGIAVRMVGPLVGLAVGLQTVAQLVEQVGHHLVADAVAEALELRRKLPEALTGPAQGRFGV